MRQGDRDGDQGVDVSPVAPGATFVTFLPPALPPDVGHSMAAVVIGFAVGALGSAGLFLIAGRF